MSLYTIFWEPQKETDFVEYFPNLDTGNADQVAVDPNWPNGYMWVEQDITPEEFAIIDTAANNHLCINLMPGPRPPYSPTGR